MSGYSIDPIIADEAEKHFSRSLKNKEIIRIILSEAENRKELFEDLIFTSKYIMGLFRAVAKQEFTNKEIINKELTESIEKVKTYLHDLVGGKIGDFGNIYLNNDNESFVRLSGLIADLELIKLYLNDIRRGS
jgi:hypothetical protein